VAAARHGPGDRGRVTTAEVHGFKSFFVRGPDGMLIELVQAAPLADLCPPLPIRAQLLVRAASL
jgi:hypothetical protein